MRDNPFRKAIEQAAADGYTSTPRVIPFARTATAAPRQASVRMATDAQLSFLRKLTREGMDLVATIDAPTAEEARTALDAVTARLGELTSAQASEAIERGKTINRELRARVQADRRAPRATVNELTDGAYRTLDGRVVRVYRTRSTGVQVGSVWNPETESFDYSGRRILRELGPELRMTEDQVAEFGRMTIVCAMCGTPLENELSRARGIGPVCITKI